MLSFISFFSIETRTPKKTTSPAPTHESPDDWHTYGDNWSSWAQSWGPQNKGDENESMTCFGSKELSHKAIKKNLTIYGAAILNNVKVGDVLTEYGRLKALHSHFNQLDVYGCTTLENCIIKKNTKIFGLLEAQSCSFESNLASCSTFLRLTNCVVQGDITINKDKGSKVQQIELENTCVEGSIIFEKNKGIILLKGASHIKGDVIGGKVIKA